MQTNADMATIFVLVQHYYVLIRAYTSLVYNIHSCIELQIEDIKVMMVSVHGRKCLNSPE